MEVAYELDFGWIFEETISESELLSGLFPLFQTDEERLRVEEEARRQLEEKQREEEEARLRQEELRRLEAERQQRACHNCSNDEATIKFSHASSYKESDDTHQFCRSCFDAIIENFARSLTDRSSRCFFCRDSISFTYYEDLRDKQLFRRDLFDLLEERVSLNSIINSGQLRYCPNPSCSFGVIVDCSECEGSPDGSCVIKCPFCAHHYCGLCGESNTVHNGKTCSELKKESSLFIWQEERKNGDEETKIKSCPQCKSTVEKNEGCNHMTCPCGHQYCWLCLTVWDDDHSYLCQVRIQRDLLEERERENERLREVEERERERQLAQREREREREAEIERQRQRQRQREVERQMRNEIINNHHVEVLDEWQVDIGELFAF